MTSTSHQTAPVAAPAPDPSPRRWSGPARIAAAVTLLVSPVLTLVATLVAPGHDDRGERLAAVASDPGAFDLATAMQVAALPFALAAVVLVSLVTWVGSPRLSVAAGVLGVAGVVGHSVVVGMELMTDAVAAGGADVEQLARIDADLSGPAVVVAAVLFLPLSVLGFLLRTAALLRSRTVPLAFVGVFAAWLVVDFSGVPVVGQVLAVLTYAWLAVMVVTGAGERRRP